MTRALSLVLPAYNEGSHLAHNVERLLQVLRSSGRTFEVVVVNDGSTDDSRALTDALADVHPEVVAVHHDRNRGKGQALQTGLLAAQHPLLVLLDADLQIPPTDVMPLVARLEAQGADLAVGSKYLPGASREWPWRRRVLSRLYQLVTAVLFRLPLRDTQTGLKVVRRGTALELMPRVHARRFAWDLEFVLLAVRGGHRVVTGPVTVQPAARASHLKWGGALQAGFDTLRIFWRERAVAAYGPRATPVRPAGLIVSGDDLGMSPNVSEGLLRGLETHGLTSVSALMTAPRSGAALAALGARVPRADVGLHLDLLQGKSLARFLWRDLTGRVPRGEVIAAVRTQCAALRAAGIEPTHMDAHRHAYLSPWTRRCALSAARACGIPAVRALRPLDPWGSPSWVERLKRLVMVGAAAFSRGQGRDRGLVEPHGIVDAQTAAGWLQRGAIPPWARGRLIEVVSHPVAGDDDAPPGEQGTLDRSADYNHVCQPPLAAGLAALGASVGTFATWTSPIGRSTPWNLPPFKPASSS